MVPEAAAIIREDLDRVDELLLSVIRQADPALRDLLLHAMEGGRRIRPTLVLLTGRMLGAPGESLVHIAAAVEMIHLATLIHDDIVDSVSLRRGSKPLYLRRNVASAVLAGDYLLAIALHGIARLGNPELLRTLSQAISRVCEGEIREYSCSGGTMLTREEYCSIISAKTAPLFAAGMRMAGIAANADRELLDTLEACGRSVGVVFQIMDDLLDIAGDAESTGKEPGSDMRRGIWTLPLIIHAEKSGCRGIRGNDPQAAPDEIAIRVLREEIVSSGAIDETRKEAREMVRCCQNLLRRLPENKYRDAIIVLAEEILGG